MAKKKEEKKEPRESKGSRQGEPKPRPKGK